VLPLAVVSIACRFPGGDTVEDFWRSLEQGRDLLVHAAGIGGVLLGYVIGYRLRPPIRVID